MILPNLMLLAVAVQTPSGIVIRGGTVYDGTGRPGFRADVRIEGDTIRQIGRVRAHRGDKVIDARGLAIAPGFIDAHSHADGGIFKDRIAETQVRQGITTAVVGEDGDSNYPLKKFASDLAATPAAINFASFVGHGTVRSRVLGNANRQATPDELHRMAALVDQEMQSGALGLSSGLEYQPGRYAHTSEVMRLAKTARLRGGIYISHVRNEDNHAFEAFRELLDISHEAQIPGEINHIKLCSTRVWHRAPQVISLMRAARRQGLDITADVYPYTYWQSTIRVIIPTEEFSNRKLWERGLADVGGPSHVLLTTYTPDPKWEGKTITELAKLTGKDPITVIQGIIDKCYGKGNKGDESVVVTAMSPDDVLTFVRDRHIMFCSDGGLHGTHPRGAGSFPRILGQYVRVLHALPLQEAIRKMTSMPAERFGFTDRGRLARGYKADVVLFDPNTVADTATTKAPQAKPIGIPMVFVNGQMVLKDGDPTGVYPGKFLRHPAKS